MLELLESGGGGDFNFQGLFRFEGSNSQFHGCHEKQAKRSLMGKKKTETETGEEMSVGFITFTQCGRKGKVRITFMKFADISN